MILGALLMGAAGALGAASPLFEWQREVADMPAMALAGGLAAVGIAVAVLPSLIRRSLELQPVLRRCVLVGVLALGGAIRLVLFVSEPALEDDYNRYLWEGALVTHGISPYRVTPEDGKRAIDTETPLGALARTAGPVLDRVNHPALTTMYQPVALLAFAAAHRISPWNVRAWRAMAMLADVTVLAVLLVLLAGMGRSPLWVALYWWNPLVAKELVNAAHFDALPVVLVLASLLLSARRAHVAAAVALGLAVGAKLWPLMLAPLLIRAAGITSRRAMAMTAIIVLAAFLSLLPRWLAGAGVADGLAAYARLWTTNSALSPLLEWLCGQVLAPLGMGEQAWRLARGLAAGLLLIQVLVVSARPLTGNDDLLCRAGEITLWIVLLSPAQFPW
ncbi:MAG: DUF2029 domain-containing protein, partial [Caldilineaceae bacterium]|nr:DUF2029 domain-containing protein [Caldilineaceae bacterium]